MATGDVTQLYNSRGRSQRDGVDSRTMGFYVEGEGVDLAKENAGVPKYRDPHPDDANMIARDIVATPSAGGSIVTVSYSPPQYVGGSVPPVNTFAEGFIGKDVSFEYENVDIPLFIRTGVLAFDNNGDAFVQIVYDTGEGEIPFRKNVAYYRVPIAIKLEGSTFDDVFNLTRIILEQTGKIHKINGEDLVFNCEGIDQQDDDTFNAVYRWYKDPGVPNTLYDSFDDPNVGTNLGRIGAVVYPYFDQDFLVPPLKGVSVVGIEDPKLPPRVTFFDKYIRDDNGWEGLPGFA